MMDARLRSSMYEGAQGSPLYTAPRKHVNPSTTGDRIEEEISDMTKWINRQLGSAGLTEQLVTDLGVDMADGITLLHLVQTLSKENLPKHFPHPIMRVQKLENLQVCLRYLEQKGLSVKGIHANDIAGSNMKTILAVCHALKRFYSSSTKSPSLTDRSGSAVPTTANSSPSSSSSSTSSEQPPAGRGRGGGGGAGGEGRSQLSFSSVDREDVALLSWLGEVVHRNIPNYGQLYDGKILCDFANEIKSGAVSELDIISGSSSERLQIAFTALETILFVRPQNLNLSLVPSGREDMKLRNYLTSCRRVHQQMKEIRRRSGGGRIGREGERGGRKGEERQSKEPSPVSREQVFESLRIRSQTPNTLTSRLEEREMAKIESRSLQGIKQHRKNGGGPAHQTGQEEEKKPGHRGSTQNVTTTTSKTTRLSTSIDSLPSATRLSAPPPSSSLHSTGRGTLHGSHDRLSRPNQRNLLPTNSRPFSDIYVAGEGERRAGGEERGGRGGKEFSREVRVDGGRLSGSVELPLSPEDWEPESLGQSLSRRSPSPALSSLPSVYQRKTPTPTPSLSLSLSSTKQLSSSSFTGLQPTTLHSKVSDASRPTPKSAGSSFTLPRARKPSLSPTSPTPPPPPIVPPPSTITPTFDLPGGKGGGRVGRKPPSSPSSPTLSLSNPESLAAEINDLHERIALLSNQLLYEKADVYTRLHRAVIRERKRRQAMEKQLREFQGVARRLVYHYDNLFVQLAKEVAGLRQEVYGEERRRKEGEEETRFSASSSGRLYLSREIDQLRQQVEKLVRRQDFHSSQVSLASSTHSNQEQLFLRKRTSSETSLHSGPFMRGSLSSYKKVSRFFGEEPPRVETIETFLEGLGYSYLLPTFTVHQISLAELHQMDSSHLEVLGIPLGPRVRIMSELAKLEPLNQPDTF